MRLCKLYQSGKMNGRKKIMRPWHAKDSSRPSKKAWPDTSRPLRPFPGLGKVGKGRDDDDENKEDDDDDSGKGDSGGANGGGTKMLRNLMSQSLNKKGNLKSGCGMTFSGANLFK